jgi:hypothetical protein
MIPLFVIVDEILVHDMPKVVLSKEHQPVNSTTKSRTSCAILDRPTRRRGKVHFKATSRRCHAKIVSRVTMQATASSTFRPSAFPFPASSRRSPSVNLGLRPFSWRFRISFSVRKYSITACWCRFSQPRFRAEGESAYEGSFSSNSTLWVAKISSGVEFVDRSVSWAKLRGSCLA